MRAATVGYVAAAGAPLLAVPSLAGGDAIDDTSVHFLLEMALLSPEEVEQLRQAEKRKLAREEKEKEEKKMREKERQELFARLTAEYLNSLSLSSSSTGKRRKKKKRKRRKLPKAPLPRCGRPCVHQQVPAVQVVHVREGAPASVHRQIGGHSCFACRDVYPQCVLCRPPPDICGVGFGSSPFLDTMHTFYELCLPSERGCVAMSCGGGFCSPDGAYDSVWDMVMPMTGKFFVFYFQYHEVVGCVCMLNYWFSSNVSICVDNYFFPVQVEGMGRSEQWEVFLFGDKTIMVDRDSSEVLPRGVSPPGIWGVGFGSSPYLATDYTIYELCLPFERGMK